MKFWFDTEFMEDGKTIDLLSIGMVNERDEKLYMENANCDFDKANPWVRDNVLPKLTGKVHSSVVIRTRVFEFVQDSSAGSKPEFWAWFGAYDWVVLCQLFGTMMDLPKGWPMMVMDLKQFQKTFGPDIKFPKQETDNHHALEDAIWTKDCWELVNLRRLENEWSW